MPHQLLAHSTMSDDATSKTLEISEADAYMAHLNALLEDQEHRERTIADVAAFLTEQKAKLALKISAISVATALGYPITIHTHRVEET